MRLALVVLLAAGCATTQVRSYRLNDAEYRIVAAGAAGVSEMELEDLLQQRAAAECPHGYDFKEGRVGSNGAARYSGGTFSRLTVSAVVRCLPESAPDGQPGSIFDGQGAEKP